MYTHVYLSWHREFHIVANGCPLIVLLQEFIWLQWRKKGKTDGLLSRSPTHIRLIKYLRAYFCDDRCNKCVCMWIGCYATTFLWSAHTNEKSPENPSKYTVQISRRKLSFKHSRIMSPLVAAYVGRIDILHRIWSEKFHHNIYTNFLIKHKHVQETHDLLREMVNAN